MRDVKTLYMQLQRHRPHIRMEVEDSVRAASDPLGKIARVREAGRQRDNAEVGVRLRRDVPHSRDDDLKDRPRLAAD